MTLLTQYSETAAARSARDQLQNKRFVNHQY
jgi:hypothetical protein